MSKRIGVAIAVAAVVAVAVGATYAVAGSRGGPVHNRPWSLSAKPLSTAKPPAPADINCVGQWAIVNANGSIAQSCGVAGVDHVNDGIYIVYFKNKAKCAPQVTIGNNIGDEPYDGVPGYFRWPNGKSSMGVTSYWQPTNDYYDADFTLSIIC